MRGTSGTARRTQLKLYDGEGRPLVIELEHEESEGGARRVCAYAGVWLLNKAGLPLLYRRRVSGGSEP